jgi:hypothetical protein
MSQMYLVTLVRAVAPVTGKCAFHPRRKARRVIVDVKNGPTPTVRPLCLECAARWSYSYGVNVETTQILTSAGSAGNAIRWADMCAEHNECDWAGFHAIDARVAPESLTAGLGFINLDVTK